MRSSIAVSMLVLATGAAGAFPVTLSLGGAPAGEYEAIERIVLDLSQGDLDQEGGLIIWNPDGTRTERAITGHDFLAISRQLTALVDHGANVEAANPVEGGVGAGAFSPFPAFNGFLAGTVLGWPFCDAASTYVYYFGTPGGAMTQRVPAPADAPQVTPPLCGGIFGATHTWLDVTIDSRALPAGTVVARQCSAAMVMAPSPAPSVGVAGGYICGKSVGSGHGNGAAVSMHFLGFAADMFRGVGNVVLVGNDDV